MNLLTTLTLHLVAAGITVGLIVALVREMWSLR